MQAMQTALDGPSGGLHDRLEVTLGWMRLLAVIWPSNILASAGEGPASAEALLLTSMYMRHALNVKKVGALACPLCTGWLWGLR